MSSTFVYPLLGFCFLIFRVWIAEIKLKNVIGDERQYMSRIFTYYLSVMLIYNFQNMTFNLLIIAVMPYMLITLFLWDIPFFKELKTMTEYDDHRFWVALERITTHLALCIAGIVPFFFDLKSFVLGGLTPGDPAIVSGYLYAVVLLFVPIMTLDVRFTKRTKWKTALMIVYGGIFFSVLWGIIIFFVY